MKVAVKQNTPGKSLPMVYPFDWSDADDFSYPLDDKGIPRVFINKKIGLRYNPITVAQYGLFNLQKYAQNNGEKYLEAVKATTNWLVENFQERRNGIGAWVYDYDLDFYGPQAPWISGMAQGEGISLLLRSHQIINDDRVLDVTQKAFQAFLHPVSEGGVASNFPDGTPVFEEFPTDPPALVLNGHIFALLGIYDYAEFWQDHAAKELFEGATAGLIKNLARYDTSFWNLYDLHPTRRLASPMYLRVHVQLLGILAELTGESEFQKMSDKWGDYLKNPICRLRWLTGKIVEKIRLRF